MSAEARTCSRTGVRVVRFSHNVRVFRVARTSFGPLNPQVRPALAQDPRAARPDVPPVEWSRWDTPGRTVYFAADAEGAFAETLSSYRRSIGGRDPLQKDADALGISLHELLHALQEEDPELLQHMHSGHLPRAWRARRALYDVVLPAGLWWVDVTHAQTMAAVERQLPWFTSSGAGSLDASHLLGADRAVTVAVAMALRALTLDDGSEPAGVVHDSRLGWGQNFAYWMRRADLQLPPDPSTPYSVDEREISPSNPALRRVAETYRLRIH